MKDQDRWRRFEEAFGRGNVTSRSIKAARLGLLLDEETDVSSLVYRVAVESIKAYWAGVPTEVQEAVRVADRMLGDLAAYELLEAHARGEVGRGC